MIAIENRTLEEKTIDAYILSRENSITLKGLGSSFHFLSEFLNTTYQKDMEEVKELKRNLNRVMHTLKTYSEIGTKLKAEVKKLETYKAKLDKDMDSKNEFKLYLSWLINKKEYERWSNEKKREEKESKKQYKIEAIDKLLSECNEQV